MIERAHAKVNLTLEILGKRSDGYHEIRSVLRTLALHDTVYIEAASAIEVICSAPELAGEANLAFRAAKVLQEVTGLHCGARIVIEKAIPVAAGLGGGSSDAAATLKGLNTFWNAELGRNDLIRLAARLGSDVPFLIHGGTAMIAGRGEIVYPLASMAEAAVLLVRPPITISTAAIYGEVTARDFSNGEASDRFANMAPNTPAHAWPLINALQPITCRRYPVVAEVLAALQSWSARQALMCGSGATFFGLFATPDAAQQAAVQARAYDWEAWVTHFA